MLIQHTHTQPFPSLSAPPHALSNPTYRPMKRKIATRSDGNEERGRLSCTSVPPKPFSISALLPSACSLASESQGGAEDSIGVGGDAGTLGRGSILDGGCGACSCSCQAFLRFPAVTSVGPDLPPLPFLACIDDDAGARHLSPPCPRSGGGCDSLPLVVLPLPLPEVAPCTSSPGVGKCCSEIFGAISPRPLGRRGVEGWREGGEVKVPG